MTLSLSLLFKSDDRAALAASRHSWGLLKGIYPLGLGATLSTIDWDNAIAAFEVDGELAKKLGINCSRLIRNREYEAGRGLVVPELLQRAKYAMAVRLTEDRGFRTAVTRHFRECKKMHRIERRKLADVAKAS